MLDLNLAKAVELIEAAIQERGADYVYPYSKCVYVLKAEEQFIARGESRGDYVTLPEPTVGCGVGVAMHLAGISLDLLSASEGSVNSLLYVLRVRGEARYTDAAFGFLREFQNQQDGGTPWGVAYTNALKTVALGINRVGERISTDDTVWHEKTDA